MIINPITSWPEIQYTPTFVGYGTVSSLGFYYVKVDKLLFIRGWFLSGTPTAVQAKISLPAGFEVTDAYVNGQIVGVYNMDAAGTVSYVLVDQFGADMLYSRADGGANPMVPLVGTAVAALNRKFTVNAVVGIL